MTDHVYKVVEIVGVSHEGQDAAIAAGLARAGQSIRNIRWFEVIAHRGFVEADGRLLHQATLKVGFTLE